MRYLAFVLLMPWLLILCWAYWAYPKNLPRTRARRAFDAATVMLALVAAAETAVIGFDTAQQPSIGPFGRASGGIWQQVLPALYGYGALLVVLAVALGLRWWLWGRRR
jgi:hypothetical protein